MKISIIIGYYNHLHVPMYLGQLMIHYIKI